MQAFFKRYWFPLLSLLLCVLAYGLLIPWLGLYWDDWALTWFSHEYSPRFFIDYAPYRPASGWLYYFFFSALGESILAWQLAALVLRWLSALAFWWLLRQVWPRAGRWVEVAALLFLIYPGFSQQPIAVTYSLYYLYYTLLLLSLGLMLRAQKQSGRRRVVSTLAALGLAATLMLSTEYFYGLELLRPELLWIVLPKMPARQRVRQVFGAWWPYLLLVVGIFIWRFQQAQGPEALYAPTLISKLLAQPFSAVPAFAAQAFGDFAEALLLAWLRLLDFWAQLDFSSMATLAYIAIVITAMGVSGWALWPREETDVEPGLRSAFGLGLAALLLSGISFWIAELQMRLRFPADRFTLPMMFGVVLLLAAAWQALRVSARNKTIALALLLGLSVGYHFYNANLYREEWERQVNFFEQLQWRAPGIKEATALLTVELPLEHYTDNSLTAPLNWLYASGDSSETLPYYVAYLDLRADAELFGTAEGEIRKNYRNSDFVGNNADVLLIYYAPPACLRVLDPVLDANFPQLPALLADEVGRSQLARILPHGQSNSIPYWDAEPQESWCYYFQRAELARQQRDWQQIAELGDIAFGLDDAANHPAERVPFIQGYALTGNTRRALALTSEALEINPLMRAMLCATWAQIAALAPDVATMDAYNEADALLTCE
jgi:hypothetical protein